MQETLPSREKWLIVGVLVLLTSAAWVVTIYQSRLHATMDGLGMSMAAPHHSSPTVSSGPAHGGMVMPGMPSDSATSTEASTALALGLGLFMAMWVAMMMAMMFPSVYPMVLLFARVSKGREGSNCPDTGADLGFRGWLSDNLDTGRRRGVSGIPPRALGQWTG